MDKVGEYKWHQISQWDQSPANSITCFAPIGNTGVTAHYMLVRVTKEIENGYQFEVCKDSKGIPVSVLNEKGFGWYSIVDHKAYYHPSVKDVLDDENEAMK